MSYQQALLEIERMEKVYKAFSETKNAIIAIASLEQANQEMANLNQTLSQEKGKLTEEVKKKKVDLQKITEIFENTKKEQEEVLELLISTKTQELQVQIGVAEVEWDLLQENQQELLEIKQEQVIVLNSEIKSKLAEKLVLENKIQETKKSIADMLK